MRKVLSIHSSVMVGFVGNSVVAPVLTVLGHYPMMLNTVTLAAHPGYGIVAGGPTPPAQIADFLAALGPLGQIGDIDQMISGYMGSVEQLDVIAPAIQSWQQDHAGHNSGRHYIFDPVMGDAGHLYIKPELANAMREVLLPLASIITPNQFELGYLSGQIVDSQASAAGAAAHLLAQHPNLQAVIATGIDNAGIDNGGKDNGGECGDLLLEKPGTNISEPIWKSSNPSAKNVSGGGDLLTALLTGYLANGMVLADAFAKASMNTQMVLAASMTGRELALRENLTKLAD